MVRRQLRSCFTWMRQELSNRLDVQMNCMLGGQMFLQTGSPPPRLIIKLAPTLKTGRSRVDYIHTEVHVVRQGACQSSVVLAAWTLKNAPVSKQSPRTPSAARD